MLVESSEQVRPPLPNAANREGWNATETRCRAATRKGAATAPAPPAALRSACAAADLLASWQIASGFLDESPGFETTHSLGIPAYDDVTVECSGYCH